MGNVDLKKNWKGKKEERKEKEEREPFQTHARCQVLGPKFPTCDFIKS